MKLTPASMRAADELGGARLIERADGAPEARAAMKGHRAEADFGNELAGAAERSIAHERQSLHGICEDEPREAAWRTFELRLVPETRARRVFGALGGRVTRGFDAAAQAA